MKKIWIGKYQNTEIKVENTQFNSERLFVNEKLQDERYGIFSSDLTGHLITEKGEKLNIKTHIGGFFTINCNVFVDDEKITLSKQ